MLLSWWQCVSWSTGSMPASQAPSCATATPPRAWGRKSPTLAARTRRTAPAVNADTTCIVIKSRATSDTIWRQPGAIVWTKLIQILNLISNLHSARTIWYCSNWIACSMERSGAPTEEKWWTTLAPPPPPAPEQAVICHHTMAHLGSTLLTCGPPNNWQMESLWLVTIVALQSSYHHQSRDWISWTYFCQCNP